MPLWKQDMEAGLNQVILLILTLSSLHSLPERSYFCQLLQNNRMVNSDLLLYQCGEVIKARPIYLGFIIRPQQILRWSSFPRL